MLLSAPRHCQRDGKEQEAPSYRTIHEHPDEENDIPENHALSSLYSSQPVPQLQTQSNAAAGQQQQQQQHCLLRHTFGFADA
ncbi:UNVERIFIED_CONTAM: hypothetical protein FKN15_058320 [Acipenser sinensis]